MDQFVGEQSRLGSNPSRLTPRRRFYWWLTLVVLLGIGGIYWYWTHHHPAPPARSGRGEQAQSVGIATVGKGDVPVTYDGLGTVTSLATVTVKTQIAGQLTEIAFKEGQLVKKGDFLAQVDPRPYQVALEQAEGALARDQAALADARLDLARYQKLTQQDSIARQQLDTQQALVRQDQGTIQADQAQIDSAKLNLVYCHIVSPVDGRVGLRQVDAGNYVQTSDANGIVVITQLQPISVIFTQPEDRLSSIGKHLRENATLQVTVFDRSGEKQIATGTVATLDNQIDTTTGTAKLRALFPNDDLDLFPNQFVNVRLLLDTLKDVTVVPTAAIQIGEKGPFVYALKSDDTVEVRQLKTGPAANGGTAVLDGLSPGERVVTDGIDRLHAGSRVRISSPSGSGGDPKPPAGERRAGRETNQSSSRAGAPAEQPERGGQRRERGSRSERGDNEPKERPSAQEKASP